LYTNTAEAWTLLDAASLQRVQLFVRGNFWEALAATVLDAPAFIVLGSLGAISIAFGTKKPSEASKQFTITKIKPF
jgi:hypothetical protein